MAFGNPIKYVQLKPKETEESIWDESILKSDKKFKQLKHSLLRYLDCY